MILAATADIHAPLYFDLFKRCFNEFRSKKIEFDLFIIAGDLIERGDISQLIKIDEIIREIEKPVIACFGNNEYMNLEDKIKEMCKNIIFLSDESRIFKLGNQRIGIIGSRGSLDQPTFWQRKNIPNIKGIYEKRINRINKLIKELKSDIRILIIHYPPTYRILEGENPRFYPQMACRKLEPVINHFDLIITAHAHNGLKKIIFNETPIYNVALPLNKEIVLIDVKAKKTGLEVFF